MSSTNVKMPVLGGGQLQGCRVEPKERSWTKEQVPVLSALKNCKIKQLNMYLLINDSKHNHRDTMITGELQAKLTEKRILKDVAKPGARYLEEDNLPRFLKKSEVWL